MGWLIDLAEAAIPEPMPEPGAKREASDPDPLWSRVAITEPSGWTLPEWQAYAGATTALGAP